MGKSKDLFIEEREKEIHEEQEQQDSEYIQLLKRLQNKEEKLSFSSLKAFSKSPREFINYKLKPKTPPGEGMILGSLCDCYLTEPDKFEKKFVVIDKVPTSENQVGFCQDMFAGKTQQEAFDNNYKRGNASDVYNSMKEYIEGHLSGKTICTSSMIEEAKAIVENLKKSELVTTVIDSCHLYQNKLEWKFNGYPFIGFTDAEGEGLIVDFKYSGKGADPDSFEREIKNMKYYLQAAMYCQAAGYDGIPEFYFVIYDRKLNFTVAKVDYSYILYGLKEYEYLVTKFHECVKNNLWQMSYNFYDNASGIKTFYKPGYLKGFETETEEI